MFKGRRKDHPLVRQDTPPNLINQHRGRLRPNATPASSRMIHLSPFQVFVLAVLCSGSTLLFQLVNQLTYGESIYALHPSTSSSLISSSFTPPRAGTEGRRVTTTTAATVSSDNSNEVLMSSTARKEGEVLVPAMPSKDDSTSTTTSPKSELENDGDEKEDLNDNYTFPKRSDPDSHKLFHDDIFKPKRSIREEESTLSYDWPEPDITSLDPSLVVTRNGVAHPSIAWLMSFPNSGTSFTIHMTREVSNCTTATNYALEGDIRNLPSVPVIQGQEGRNGPFFELIRDRFTAIPNMILTKTHCTGYCSLCGPWKLLLETPRSFQRGCLAGTRAVRSTNGTLETFDVMYEASLVKKAIHIFRHPLDNIVARFHLEFNEMKEAGNSEYTTEFPKNATGFRKWCRRSDRNKKLLETKYVDDDIKRALIKIPCFNEFHKYVQWHNMAFYTSHDMQIETLLLHYHEYSTNFDATRDKILTFLELPNVGTPIQFHPGKEYRHYYTIEQKRAIQLFIREYATPDTWEELKDYDYEIDEERTTLLTATSTTQQL